MDFDSIVARVHVPEKELGRLAPNQTVRIVAPALGGREFAGRVERLSPVVDPQSGTVKVTVDVPPQGAAPGMYVDVALVTAVHPDALHTDGPSSTTALFIYAWGRTASTSSACAWWPGSRIAPTSSRPAAWPPATALRS